MSAVFTARWKRGGLVLAVACPHGRTWAYPVVPVGDKPLPHFLWETPWVVCPGSEWGTDDGKIWLAAVVPVSPEAAAELFAPDSALLPPGHPTVAGGRTYPGKDPPKIIAATPALAARGRHGGSGKRTPGLWDNVSRPRRGIYPIP